MCKVVAYRPKKLKEYKIIYPIHDLKLATVIFSLMIWLNYFYSEQFDVYNDQGSLKPFPQKE